MCRFVSVHSQTCFLTPDTAIVNTEDLGQCFLQKAGR